MDQILDWGLTGRKMVRLHFAHKCAHAYTGTHPRNCNLVLQNKHIIHPQGNDGKIYHFRISFSGPKVNDNLVCVLAKWHFHSCKKWTLLQQALATGHPCVYTRGPRRKGLQFHVPVRRTRVYTVSGFGRNGFTSPEWMQRYRCCHVVNSPLRMGGKSIAARLTGTILDPTAVGVSYNSQGEGQMSSRAEHCPASSTGPLAMPYISHTRHGLLWPYFMDEETEL